MAEAGSEGRVRVAAELLFAQRLPRPLRVFVPLVVAAGSVALGAWMLTVQHHYAALHSGGRVATLLARGSSAVTVWEGWAAAGFFLAALIRLRRGAPEPPAGRTPVEDLTLQELRRGLVREYTAVRIALVVLCVASLADVARAARYIVAAASADALARTALPAILVEAAGLVVATIVLGLWAGSFREQLQRMGALA